MSKIKNMKDHLPTKKSIADKIGVMSGMLGDVRNAAMNDDRITAVTDETMKLVNIWKNFSSDLKLLKKSCNIDNDVAFEIGVFVGASLNTIASGAKLTGKAVLALPKLTAEGAKALGDVLKAFGNYVKDKEHGLYPTAVSCCRQIKAAAQSKFKAQNLETEL